jgi:hypothetical protein
MAYVTPITYEDGVFLGTMASCEALGGKYLSTRERTTVAAGGFSDPVLSYVGPDGRTMTAGDIYIREVIEHTVGQAPTLGPWQFYASTGDPKVATLRAVNLNRQTASAPGQPMRNPLGLPIVFADGTRPLQPGSGEQARDQWTGQLQFDAQGQPVLLP